VAQIVHDVSLRGDEALFQYTLKFDGCDLTASSIEATPAERKEALAKVKPEDREVIELAARRIEKYHRQQIAAGYTMRDEGCGELGQRVLPLQRVGIYAPGGKAFYPSTLLMAAIPARIAGVGEIVQVSPAKDGRLNPLIAAAADVAGVDRIFKIGGAQAIAALAYGSASIRRVDKIVGAGSLLVNLAKQQVFGAVGVDNLAGPSETVVIADAAANPAWVAADLVAQLEHDPLASAILMTPSVELIGAVQAEIDSQVGLHPRAEVITAALGSRSGAVQTRDIEEAVQLANELAPEHVSLSVSDPWRLVERITTAGAVFVGEHSFEVLGDYLAGPGSIAPTGGAARFSGPLTVLDFIHLVNLVALDPTTTRWIAPAAAILAEAEGLAAHAAAARARL
jgi:histidinol dehydrogenase